MRVSEIFKFSLTSCVALCIQLSYRINIFHSFRNGSLVDHMLVMMEKYTNNLEDIVADRTRQLEEEKGKTETLLYKMLPK